MTRKNTIIFLVIITSLMLSSCKSIRQFEKEKKISYDPIICDYASSPTCGTIEDFVTTHVTVYADNKIVICIGDSEEHMGTTEIKDDDIYEEEFEITKKQKKKILSEIRNNQLILLGDCGNNDSTDGNYHYIHLFDKDGKVVYTTGGLNPDSERFKRVIDVICNTLPEDAINNVYKKAMNIQREKSGRNEDYNY